MEDSDNKAAEATKPNIHPGFQANIFSRLFFLWQLRTLFKGTTKNFSEDVVYETPPDLEAKYLGDKLEEAWCVENILNKTPSFTRALFKAFGFELLVPGLMYPVLNFFFTLSQSVILNNLLIFFSPNQMEITKTEACVNAALLVMFSLFRTINLYNFYLFNTTMGMKVNIACSSLIYRKCLKLRRSTLEKATVGQIINLLSSDVNKIESAAYFFQFIWIPLLEIIVTFFLLDTMLGHTATVGIAVLILCMTFQVYLSRILSKSRLRIATKTDYRIRLMNEIICGIQVIKMYTWEQSFAKLVETARKLEMKEITKAAYYRMYAVTTKNFITRVVTFFCILSNILLGLPLTAQFIFILGSIYDALRIDLITSFPQSSMSIAEAMSSVKRIEDFLGLPERSKIFTTKTASSGISVHNISVKWDKSSSHYSLKEVSFGAVSGQLVAVIGAAGSGKSTLLQALLKEVELEEGNIYIGGTISYASQEPWIFSGSIRQNILFGEEMNSDKYNKVIRICALEYDISVFPYGDRTTVGERGVMLSGGQKSRINLARAIYRDADIYLLDDPLSAVDTHVAKQIFQECISGYLKEKCTILVTHQLQFLGNVENIYVMESGEITASGTYKELIDYIKTAPQPIVDEEEIYGQFPLRKIDIPVEVRESISSTDATSWKVYKHYFFSGQPWSIVIINIALFLLVQVVGNFMDFFLTCWVNLEQDLQTQYETSTDRVFDFFTRSNNFVTYAILLLVLLSLILFRSWLFIKMSMKASRILHNNMISKIIYSGLTFFNSNPSGRILNRFSKDLGVMDERIPLMISDTVVLLLNGLGYIILICIVNHWMMVPSVILFALCYCYCSIFRTNIKGVARVQAIKRSPIFSHVAASLRGLVTIRAFKVQNLLEQEFSKHQDRHCSVYYLQQALIFGLCFWMDLICVTYTAILTFTFLTENSETYVGNFGLAMVQSFALMGMLPYALKCWGELDTELTSVERVIEYGELVPEQDPGNDLPPKEWPIQGNVQYQAVSLRYSLNDSYALERVSFQVKSGEKIGIIGRTGAGKSSLMSTLFHLFEFEGRIIIDGIDTKQIPLKELRSKIGVIPQDPVLFQGTLRKNLDPFGQFTDSEIWNALEEVKLKSTVSKLSLGLENPVLDSGSNFSLGEKQLLCLARAILRNTKIIVLDEATASIDLNTDKLIQTTIRRKFKNCTVLTIAHRLNTVMDSDKILVLDEGTVKEFGNPNDLLQNTEGSFYGYVKRAGRGISEFGEQKEFNHPYRE